MEVRDTTRYPTTGVSPGATADASELEGCPGGGSARGAAVRATRRSVLGWARICAKGRAGERGPWLVGGDGWTLQRKLSKHCARAPAASQTCWKSPALLATSSGKLSRSTFATASSVAASGRMSLLKVETATDIIPFARLLLLFQLHCCLHDCESVTRLVCTRLLSAA